MAFYKDKTKISFKKIVAEDRMKRWIWGTWELENYWYEMIIMVGNCHYVFVQTHGLRKPDYRSWIWVMGLYQYWFIHDDRPARLVVDTDHGGWACAGGNERMRNPQVPPCCVENLKLFSNTPSMEEINDRLEYGSGQNTSPGNANTVLDWITWRARREESGLRRGNEKTPWATTSQHPTAIQMWQEPPQWKTSHQQDFFLPTMTDL